MCLLLATIPIHVGAGSSSFSRDYYKVLGVPRDCNQKDLQRAYRKLALRHHPDKGGKEEQFKEINEAYDVLSDDTKRRQYDQFGTADGAAFGGKGNPNFNFHRSQQQQQQQYPQHGGQRPQQHFTSSFFSFGGNPQQAGPNPFQHFGMFSEHAGPPGSGSAFGGPTHIDLGDVLQQMMGGAGGGGWSQSNRQTSPRRQRPETSTPNSYTRNVSCSLEELALGATKKLKVRHKVQGLWHEQIYQIQLQPHWKTGTKVRFPARRLPSSSSAPALFPAMTFVIQQAPHAFLKRRGAHDVVYTCHISRRQAKQGLRLSIPCVLVPHDDEHHDVELVLTPESHPRLFPLQTGASVTVPHRGMPRRRHPSPRDRTKRHDIDDDHSRENHDRGDFLVEFVVD